jgi:[CysO sulfur-carrier protein]-S-L-cysteine hydrolase
MQLLLAPQVVKRLQRELRRAGSREIGGLMMGEHVRDELFRVVEISVQRSGGSHAGFTRKPGDHQAQLRKFFTRTGNHYARFNYLGEWHSHPSFDLIPSTTDLTTMQSIVEDQSVGVNFLVLLVAKLGPDKRPEATATAFRARTAPLSVPLQAEPDATAVQEGGFIRWLHKKIGT